jgi:hypothetical protein
MLTIKISKYCELHEDRSRDLNVDGDATSELNLAGKGRKYQPGIENGAAGDLVGKSRQAALHLRPSAHFGNAVEI